MRVDTLNYDNLSFHLQGGYVDFSNLFGPRLKGERKRLGMSQIDAADFAGVTRQMWGKYERGDAEPGIFIISRFCAHGADALYIVTGMRAPPTASVDTDLLRQVIEGVEYALDNNNLTLATVYKSKLIALLYEQFSESKQVEQAVVNRFLQAATR